MDNIKTIHLDDATMDFAEELAKILNEDTKLQNALGSTKIKTTGNEFITSCKEWALSRNADMFIIVLNRHAIGTISLSHKDLDSHKAQIGYWICSNYWGNGYASQAFSEVLSFARRKGIAYVSASIVENNVASRRIWEKNSANLQLNNNRYHVSIYL